MKISEIIREEIDKFKAEGEIISYSHLLHKIRERKFNINHISNTSSVLDKKRKLYKIIRQR